MKSKFQIRSCTYSTDGLIEYFHNSPITKLVFVSKIGGANATIGVLDELGMVSSWSVMEINSHLVGTIGETDLNLTIGGRFKLIENFQENLMFIPESGISMLTGLDIA